MRLFYALWPEAVVQQTLGAWAGECRGACGGRRIPAEKMHVTVAFLGEVASERYSILTAIGHALRTEAFDLVFDRVAYWRNSRIVYAAPSRVPNALAGLADNLKARLAAAGFETDDRPFAPHVTLLREAARAPREVSVAALAWQVGALTLVETLREDGKLAYRIRERWTLGK